MSMAGIYAFSADPVSRKAAQPPISASGITETNTQTRPRGRWRRSGRLENPPRLAATPEIAAPAAAPVWRTAEMPDEPMARSSSRARPARGGS